MSIEWSFGLRWFLKKKMTLTVDHWNQKNTKSFIFEPCPVFWRSNEGKEMIFWKCWHCCNWLVRSLLFQPYVLCQKTIALPHLALDARPRPLTCPFNVSWVGWRGVQDVESTAIQNKNDNKHLVVFKGYIEHSMKWTCSHLKKIVVGRLLSFWEGLFFGAMLVWERVYTYYESGTSSSQSCDIACFEFCSDPGYDMLVCYLQHSPPKSMK